MMGECGVWLFIWIMIYKVNVLMFECYWYDCVLFCGDVVYFVLIFGVCGVNLGIDDVDNIVWKFVYVICGIVLDVLFDSYLDECVFVVYENLCYGMKSIEFMVLLLFVFVLMCKVVLMFVVWYLVLCLLINLC